MTPLLLLLDFNVINPYFGDRPLQPDPVRAVAGLGNAQDRTIMLDVGRGMYLYSLSPKYIVSITMPVFLSLPLPDAARWLTDYHVSYALLRKVDGDIAGRLMLLGFQQINATRYDIIMAAPEADQK